MFITKMKVCLDKDLNAKNTLLILFFNKFLADIIQEDILNISSKKIKNVFTFLVHFTSLNDDKDVSNLIFKFLFGFEQKASKNIGETKLYDSNYNSAIALESDDISSFNSEINSIMVTNETKLRNLYEDKIDRNEHYIEEIIATLTKIIETPNTSHSNNSEVKTKLIIILNNLMKKSYHLFLKELINPFYCYIIFNNFKNNFKEILTEYENTSSLTFDTVNYFKSVITPKYFNLLNDFDNQDRKILTQNENSKYQSYISSITDYFNKLKQKENYEGGDLDNYSTINYNNSVKDKDKDKDSKGDKVDKQNSKPLPKELYTNIVQNVRVI